jgi:hypothetical protein
MTDDNDKNKITAVEAEPPRAKVATGPVYRVTVDRSEEGVVKFAVFPEHGDEPCERKFRELSEGHGFSVLTLTGATSLGPVLKSEAGGAATVRTFAWSAPSFVEIDPSNATDESLSSAFSVVPPGASAEPPREHRVSFIGMLRLIVSPEEYRGYLKCRYLEAKLTGHDAESEKFLRWLDEAAQVAT